MDEVRITSDLSRQFISWLIGKLVKKKTGCDLKLDLKAIKVEVGEGGVSFHLNADGTMDKESFTKLMKAIKSF